MRWDVGPLALAGVEAHFADLALFSVRGVSEAGHLTDPDQLEADVKRAMIRHARRPTLLIDGSKFQRPALSVIASATTLALVLAADVADGSLAPFEHRRRGDPLRVTAMPRFLRRRSEPLVMRNRWLASGADVASLHPVPVGFTRAARR